MTYGEKETDRQVMCGGNLAVTENIKRRNVLKYAVKGRKRGFFRGRERGKRVKEKVYVQRKSCCTYSPSGHPS